MDIGFPPPHQSQILTGVNPRRNNLIGDYITTAGLDKLLGIVTLQI